MCYHGKYPVGLKNNKGRQSARARQQDRIIPRISKIMSRANRFYHPDSLSVGQTVLLKEDTAHHAALVLRMQSGDQLTLFSDNNDEYDATIMSVNKKKVLVRIDDHVSVSRESNLNIHLVQAMVKGDKMPWIIQKAVELGAASITPLLTSRTVMHVASERFEKKCSQWESVAQGACEQSGRNTRVKICYPLEIDDMLQSPFAGLSFILHPHHGRAWFDYEKPVQPIRLIVGPEGGFSEDEVARMLAHGFLPLKFGPRVLRSETAAIAGLSVLQAVWGDLH